MEKLLGSKHYMELKEQYEEALDKAVELDSDTKILINIQDLTTTKQVTFVHELEQVAH